MIRIWEVTEGREVYSQDNSLLAKSSEEGGLSVVHLLFNEERNFLAVISVDHNVIIHDLETFRCEKQVGGFCTLIQIVINDMIKFLFITKHEFFLYVCIIAGYYLCQSF
jgi:hypothetical protein